ncbi:hypothetical protein Q5Y75_26510 [Ruegeria sp. 2205SS24-7]|uniref:hypothetical protein n=1 Tax=Ruegeria discodermiae TaxID=3064389 RepID=UPI0027426679|nr:hypothetical protein [Ruegeria sp. 2205SS24-7]MDP5220745.1 hypothetical protein [Ruegeria sp. 2205SS24-7]
MSIPLGILEQMMEIMLRVCPARGADAMAFVALIRPDASPDQGRGADGVTKP